MGLMLPVGDQGRTLFRLHIEPGQGNKVIGAQLHMGSGAVLKVQFQLKAVIHLIIGDVGTGAVQPDDLLLKDLQDLVNKVDAPVQDHTAAVLLLPAPVAGDTPGAVDTGLKIQNLSDLTAGSQLLHCQKIHIPAAVVVNGEKLACLFAGSNHPVYGSNAHFHGLFADHMLACFQCGNNQRFMEIIGRCDHHRIHLGICQQLLVGSIHMDPVGCSSISADLPDIIGSCQIAYITL